jgi:hypothetical protein
MDPYLEHPEFFPGLHDRLINQLSDALQAVLPRPYYAEIRSRVWIEYTERTIEPDVSVPRSNQRPGPPPVASPGSGAVAVTLNPVVVIVPTEENRELFVEICTTRGEQPLVTVIEVLSPGNKKAGEVARKKYQEKQKELLASRVNLLEIDLLRGGNHTTAVPHPEAVAAAGAFDYHACLRRMDELEQRHVYPICLQQKLPAVAVPLLPGDADVSLDLQTVFDHCYDRGPYQHHSPYQAHEPEPPLTPEQAAWAARLLRDNGSLPAP